ncbi:hypothetical protein QOZ89_43720 [Pseudofrankia sp. BMG5.37]|nr:hypothetical protein [Pseudofrankia sp. BMG5.37]
MATHLQRPADDLPDDAAPAGHGGGVVGDAVGACGDHPGQDEGRQRAVSDKLVELAEPYLPR